MKRVKAVVTGNQQVLRQLERYAEKGASRSRDILSSWIFRFKCPEIAREAKPGQYLMINCGGDTLLPRPFSVHFVRNSEVAVFYSVLEGGKGTGWLSHLEEDEEIELFGPLGNGFEISPDSNHLLLVAGGMGIAPLYYVAQMALNQGKRVTMCIGASGEISRSGEKNPNQIYPLNMLSPGIRVETITSSEDGRSNMVTELIPEHVERSDQVFACGPSPMYQAMAAMAELKDKDVQVSLETRMACGRGICYGCTVKTRDGLKKVCQDGPVFNLRDIVWEELNPV